MTGRQLVFRAHALRRMFERKISVADVRRVLEEGEEIASYPDDRPYPSRLVLGWRGERALHVVVAENRKARETIVITAYEPDHDLWGNDFRTRRT